MRIVRSVVELREALAPRRGAGIGLVPTMGAFHSGHLALMRLARTEQAAVVVSLFVNPAQFVRGEDLERYPRDEARDAELANAEGVDVLFAPPNEEVYRPGHDTWVDVGRLGEVLEGEHRPGHFRGVATVCLKLFNMVQPDAAYFGQKDAQQVAVVCQLVRDLDLPLEIRVLPTVRDEDGLALSSRNVYLSPDDRARALALPRAMAAGLDAHRSGNDPVAAAQRRLQGLDVDYVAVADFGIPTLAAAIRVGGTRLIDNVPLDEEPA
jgi:pantoate--beta-alanine ligase